MSAPDSTGEEATKWMDKIDGLLNARSSEASIVLNEFFMVRDDEHT
jgi:hypothetical protein